MVLVDTSVWVDHLRKGEPRLVELLERNQVLMHPSVRGELACGNLNNRSVVLAMLSDLPAAVVASDDEVMGLIERQGLMGRGIGYVDVHLLAATALSAPASLWTKDRALESVAVKIDLAWLGGAG